MYARTGSAGAGTLATRALAGAAPRSFWLDHPDAPQPLPALATATTADLAIVGGGFTGLWTALLAKERDPAADVVVLEARTVGWAASGRNGGFCSSSLTHGLENGLARFPDEMPVLERLGMENFREIGETVARHGIDCDFRLSGEISVATAPWQLDGIEEEVRAARKLGHEVEMLDAGAVRRELDSPTFLGGTWHKGGTAMLEPGRLAYAAGYTGLGVGATRFGAQVMLDLLGKADTERTRLKLVRSKPVPFPPEPARSAVIQLTRASIAQADRNDGRRNLWLRTLDRLGLGFDS